MGRGVLVGFVFSHTLVGPHEKIKETLVVEERWSLVVVDAGVGVA